VEHKTEPNSGLGKAISYLLNHWPKLTLFLRQPGAPIDNNIAERALKKAILNRGLRGGIDPADMGRSYQPLDAKDKKCRPSANLPAWPQSRHQ